METGAVLRQSEKQNFSIYYVRGKRVFWMSLDCMCTMWLLSKKTELVVCAHARHEMVERKKLYVHLVLFRMVVPYAMRSEHPGQSCVIPVYKQHKACASALSMAYSTSGRVLNSEDWKA